MDAHIKTKNNLPRNTGSRKPHAGYHRLSFSLRASIDFHKNSASFLTFFASPGLAKIIADAMFFHSKGGEEEEVESLMAKDGGFFNCTFSLMQKSAHHRSDLCSEYDTNGHARTCRIKCH